MRPSREVAVLVTYDIHISTYGHDEVDRYLHTLIEEHERSGIKASLCFPSEAARLLKPTVRQLIAAGHAIGNHGLTHGPDEIYDILSPNAQQETLRQATAELEEVTGQPIRFFRAPIFRMNGSTIAALDRLGYDAELSMNSQRLGLLSSDPWNVTWMLAPRSPYHPATSSVWRRGSSRLWEIPLSCLILPFMSNTMLFFGLDFIKAFFRALYVESRLTGKPIVFMTHPEELHAERKSGRPPPFRWRHLLPTQYGFGFRHGLMERDPVKIARNSKLLFDYMRSFAGVRFLTVPEYVQQLNGEANARVLVRGGLEGTHSEADQR